MWLVVGLGLVALAGPLVGTASAHATLVSSSPGNDEVVEQPPDRVVLTFDDGVVVDDAGVRVLDPRGNDVSEGAPTTSDGGTEVRQRIDAEAEDTYTLSYRALSDDGHVIDSSYVFHIGHHRGGATATTITGGEMDGLRILNAFGRWIALSAALLVGGVLAMSLFVDGPRAAVLTRSQDRNGRDLTAESRGDADGVRSSGWATELASARFLLLPGACAVLFGLGISLLASAADLAGGSLLDGPGGVADFVTSSRPGWVFGVRLLVALVLVLAVMGSTAIRRVPWLTAIAILATLVLPSLGGHAWTASPEALSVASDALHVLAAAAWAGALGVVVLSWDGERGRATAFSRMALVAAPLTITTGLLNTWLQERSAAGVVDSTHGRLAMAKLLGALVMVGFGWIHRRQIADAARWSTGALRSYRAEAAVGLAVVAVTAVLVGTSPGREARPAGEPVQQVRQAGEVTVRMQVTPAAAGPNDVHLYYLARDGSLTAVDAAELEISSAGIAPRSVPVAPITANHGFVDDLQLTPGEWSFELTIVTGGAPATTTFRVPIA